MKHNTNTADTAYRICIVTSDFAGITHNGGIGTACANLSYMLASKGHNVSILYTYGDIGDGKVLTWQKKLAEKHITLIPLSMDTTTSFGTGSFHQMMSLNAYLWLREHDHFDIIHFPDWRGTGYYTTLAKRTGIAFQNTHISIHLHSPTLWHRIHNKEDMASIDLIDTHILERQAIAQADSLISPSQYLIDWCIKQGWTLPPHTQVIQNLLSPNFPLNNSYDAIAADDITEIVFFGRLEIRKGLLLFCHALKKLPASLLKGKTITFLGKNSLIGKKDSLTVLEESLKSLAITWQTITDYNSDQAINYLQGKGRVAVIASLIENSPYVVLESLGFGFPFIATNSGGTAELIAAKDRPKTLFTPQTQELRKHIKTILTQGATRAHMHISQQDTTQQWLDFHQQATALPASPHISKPLINPTPIGVCVLTTGQAINQLKQTLLTLQHQLCSPLLDIIVVPLSPISHSNYIKIQKLCTRLHIDVDTPRQHLPCDVFFPTSYNHVLFMDEYTHFQAYGLEHLIHYAQHNNIDMVTNFTRYYNPHKKPLPHIPVCADNALLQLYPSVSIHHLLVKQSLFSTNEYLLSGTPNQCIQQLASLAHTHHASIDIIPESLSSVDITKKTQLLQEPKIHKKTITALGRALAQ